MVNVQRIKEIAIQIATSNMVADFIREDRGGGVSEYIERVSELTKEAKDVAPGNNGKLPAFVRTLIVDEIHNTCVAETLVNFVSKTILNSLDRISFEDIS